MITEKELDNWFMYHEPSDKETIQKYTDIREAGKMFAKMILMCTPPSADQTAAIRKVREAVMTANAAIACGGK